MDIGVPYRDLGPVDVSALVEKVRALPEEAWTRNTFRQDALAAKNHETAKAILFRHEWDIYSNTAGYPYLEQLIWAWCRGKGKNPEEFMPIEVDVTDMGRIYTFPDYLEYREAIEPIVVQVLSRLGYARAVVTRLALVGLAPKVKITPHIDGQPMAAKAHRVHIALSESPGVRYRIGSRDFTMKLGHAYDFNNKRKHSVENNGKNMRVNLFLDVYPEPSFSQPGEVLRA